MNTPTEQKPILPAHLQMIADRINNNYKGVKEVFESKIACEIIDVTPEGYGPSDAVLQ